MLMNQNVYNYFIFFDKSELVINDKDIYTWENFYQLYLHSEEYSSFEEWKQDMMNTSMTYGVKEEQTYDYRNIGKSICCALRVRCHWEKERLMQGSGFCLNRMQ